MKGDHALIHREHPVRHERVEVDIQIEGAAEALHDRHGAAPAVGDAVTSGATPQEPEHRTQCDAGHGPTQLVIPRQQVPQPMRQAEDPLSNRHVREDMIDEMRRPLSHAPVATPRAEPAAVAREGHEAIQSAGGAPKSGEAAGQTPATQEVAELLLDKSREPLAVPPE